MTARIATLLFALSLPCFALEKFGFLTGINLSSANYQLSKAAGPQAVNTQVGPYIEGSFQIPIVEYLSFSGGLSVVGKGSKQTTASDTFTFFELPLRLKMELPYETVTPYLFGGLSWGMLLSGHETATDGSETDMVNSLYRNELCALIGAGMEIKIAHDTSLDFSVTYSQGLNNLMATVPESYGNLVREEVYYRSKGIYLGVGLRIYDRPIVDDSESRARDYLERRTQPGAPLLPENAEQVPET